MLCLHLGIWALKSTFCRLSSFAVFKNAITLNSFVCFYGTSNPQSRFDNSFMKTNQLLVDVRFSWHCSSIYPWESSDWSLDLTREYSSIRSGRGETAGNVKTSPKFVSSSRLNDKPEQIWFWRIHSSHDHCLLFIVYCLFCGAGAWRGGGVGGEGLTFTPLRFIYFYTYHNIIQSQ